MEDRKRAKICTAETICVSTNPGMQGRKNKTGTSLQAASENKKNIITLKLFGQMILQLYSDLDKCLLSGLLLNTRETGWSPCQPKLIKARQMCLDSGVPHTHNVTHLHTCKHTYTSMHAHAHNI